MNAEHEALNSLVAGLEHLSDDAVARVLTQYTNSRGMPSVTYSIADISEVILNAAQQDENIKVADVTEILIDVTNSEEWKHLLATTAQTTMELILHDTVKRTIEQYLQLYK